jgi:hypothetical protein
MVQRGTIMKLGPAGIPVGAPIPGVAMPGAAMPGMPIAVRSIIIAPVICVLLKLRPGDGRLLVPWESRARRLSYPPVGKNTQNSPLFATVKLSGPGDFLAWLSIRSLFDKGKYDDNNSDVQQPTQLHLLKTLTAEEPPNHGGRGRQSFYEVWQCSDSSFRIRLPVTITGRVFLTFPRRISFGQLFVRSRLRARLWFGSVSFMSRRSERRRRLSDLQSWNAIFFGIN